MVLLGRRAEPTPVNTPYTISSFGEDQAGELYVVDRGGGTIYRFAQVP